MSHCLKHNSCLFTLVSDEKRKRERGERIKIYIHFSLFKNEIKEVLEKPKPVVSSPNAV